jgi:hypothetical protein
VHAHTADTQPVTVCTNVLTATQCASYAQTGACTSQYTYMSVNCRLTCGLCTSAGGIGSKRSHTSAETVFVQYQLQLHQRRQIRKCATLVDRMHCWASAQRQVRTPAGWNSRVVCVVCAQQQAPSAVPTRPPTTRVECGRRSVRRVRRSCSSADAHVACVRRV